MSEILYSRDHLWLAREEDGAAKVGITDYAQKELGDILFVELPDIGAALAAGESFGVIESVKTASELIAPASGEVVEVNELLREEPWQINDAAQDQGWILRMQCADLPDDLMDAEAYRDLVGPGPQT